jgi:hypothetical protein
VKLIKLENIVICYKESRVFGSICLSQEVQFRDADSEVENKKGIVLNSENMIVA